MKEEKLKAFIEAIVGLLTIIVIGGGIFYYSFISLTNSQSQLINFVCPNMSISYSTCSNYSNAELDILQQQILFKHIKN